MPFDQENEQAKKCRKRPGELCNTRIIYHKRDGVIHHGFDDPRYQAKLRELVMTSMVKNNIRKSLSIGFTVFNVLFFFPLLAVAYTAPMGLGGSSYEHIALFFVIFSWLSPLSVPIGIYKGWQNINSPSIRPFLFYHLLPIISFTTVIAFCMVVAYWLW